MSAMTTIDGSARQRRLKWPGRPESNGCMAGMRRIDSVDPPHGAGTSMLRCCKMKPVHIDANLFAALELPERSPPSASIEDLPSVKSEH